MKIKVFRQPLYAFLFFFILLIFSGCSSQVNLYIEMHPDLPPEKIVAMQNRDIINGMTAEEVEIVLGKPTFVERKSKETVHDRWVYRNISGVKKGEAYDTDTSFPQGIGFVVPLNYQCKEIRIDFLNGKVCRVEKILS